MQCENCGGPLRAGNKVGICKRNKDCRNANRRKRHNGRVTDAGKCKICGGSVRADNKVGICSRNEDCRKAREQTRVRHRNYEPVSSYIYAIAGCNFLKIGKSTKRHSAQLSKTKCLAEHFGIDDKDWCVVWIKPGSFALESLMQGALALCGWQTAMQGNKRISEWFTIPANVTDVATYLDDLCDAMLAAAEGRQLAITTKSGQPFRQCG